MTKVFHGGRLDAAIAEFGGSREDWLDLSTGINPVPWPVGEISNLAWQALPDERMERDLIAAARDYYRVPAAMEIVAANGTQALIELLPELTGINDVAIVSPTYGEHAHCWKKHGRNVVPVGDIDGAIKSGCKAAVVVNPNNPDCRIHSVGELKKLASRTEILIVDEAFCDSEPEHSFVSQMPENVIVLKSFGKFFGLAGVRLGFAVCKTEWVGYLKEKIGPWAVSGPALEIGAYALKDSVWIEHTKLNLRKMAASLSELLSSLGFQVDGVNPLFVYASHEKAEAIYEFLASQKILVRPFPENPKYLRLGLPANETGLQRLETALEDCPHV
ncbi:MAG: threonine-phosphate decarboxylase CobD [Pseudomonadota bacterium]